MYAIFNKSKNAVNLVCVLNATSRDDALKLIGDSHSIGIGNKGFLGQTLRDIFSDKDMLRVNNTQMEEGGCYFVIEGETKIVNFWKDELWIKKIKSDAKDYRDKGFYYIEAQRLCRQGKSISKCLTRIEQLFPDFSFKPENDSDFLSQAEQEIESVTYKGHPQ